MILLYPMVHYLAQAAQKGLIGGGKGRCKGTILVQFEPLLLEFAPLDDMGRCLDSGEYGLYVESAFLERWPKDVQNMAQIEI